MSSCSHKSEEIRNPFHQLLPAPYNPITRPLNYRIHYSSLTLTCSSKISSDADDSLFAGM